ncbi:MurR/RpiR family transcriptional regulator [Streptacidiphilus griseoplanus]|uniref:MurR/RpiR family transcriptional regulator n=1 Tax=Peterkaempfera griseoplana TaxID=66896 RepID=UPI0006E2C19E|nr:helix-turn-helix domain-containing protein [Peterkaempfera griseoplana]
MPEDLLTLIRARRDQLSRAEGVIADLVLADPGAAAERTITELAQAAGTSEATVHRFCRSLELRGYAQLRLALAAEAERLQTLAQQARLVTDALVHGAHRGRPARG